jgi:alpha-beta hydrolase superfamily lysophospholipase
MLKSELIRKERGMEHSEFFWKSFDGLNLFSQIWVLSEKPKALNNLVHGIGEHSGRYKKWAGQLAAKGYAVRSFDHRIHGRSDGKRRYSSEYHKLLNDLKQFLEKRSEMFPSLPSFLYGHSFGGNLILNCTIQDTINSIGLVITSPWLELTQKPSKLKLLFVLFLGNLIPGMLLKTGLKAEDISRDLRAVFDYKNDILVHDKNRD